MRQYTLDLRAGEVKLLGIQHGQARVLARNASNIVVAFAGHGENPGSRYSGLYNYYPAETTVYEIRGLRDGNPNLLEVEECITWQTRKATKAKG